MSRARGEQGPPLRAHMVFPYSEAARRNLDLKISFVDCDALHRTPSIGRAEDGARRPARQLTHFYYTF